MTDLTQRVLGRFNALEDSFRLRLEGHTLLDNDGFAIPIFSSLSNPIFFVRQYPDVQATIEATIGSVRYVGSRVQEVTREVVQFQGNSESSTKYPIVANLNVENIGRTFDETGQIIDVDFSERNGIIIASQSFYGAVLVSYQSAFRLIEYTYRVEPFAGGGARVIGGSVLAFRDTQVASFEVPPPELPQQDSNLVMLYEDVSETIVTQDDEYEKPPDWTGQPGSPTWPEGLPDPEEPFFTVRRVHKAVFIDDRCRPITRNYRVRIVTPKQTDPNFEPEITREETDLADLIAAGIPEFCVNRAKTLLVDTE